MKALYSWERSYLEGPHDAEAMERSALMRGKNCAEGVDMRTKREGLVKGHTKKLGVGLNVRGVPVRVSWG